MLTIVVSKCWNDHFTVRYNHKIFNLLETTVSFVPEPKMSLAAVTLWQTQRHKNKTTQLLHLKVQLMFKSWTEGLNTVNFRIFMKYVKRRLKKRLNLTEASGHLSCELWCILITLITQDLNQIVYLMKMYRLKSGFHVIKKFTSSAYCRSFSDVSFLTNFFSSSAAFPE